jgi:hypothetical protein
LGWDSTQNCILQNSSRWPETKTKNKIKEVNQKFKKKFKNLFSSINEETLGHDKSNLL